MYPLPLLVSEGEEYEPDFGGNNNKLYGTWTRDSISVENTVLEEFTELVPNFYD